MPFCPEAAGAAGQPPLLAGAAVTNGGSIVEAQLRPVVGGPGTATAPLAARGATTVAPALAVAPNGAAVSAWIERRGTLSADGAAVLVALRAPGASTFGPARQLGLTAASAQAPLVAIDGAGRAHVAWSQRSRAMVASSVPGAARFGTPQQLGGSAFGAEFALAAAPGGRALAVANDDSPTDLFMWELAPGARRFTRVQRIAAVSGDELAAAVRDDGGAAVLARSGLEGVTLLRRTPGGRFGRATTLRTPGSARSASACLGRSSPSSARARSSRPRARPRCCWPRAASWWRPGPARR